MSQSNTDAAVTADEIVAKTVWPTIGATSAGRWVGQLAGSRIGVGNKFFTLGTLMAVVTIPVSLAVYAWQLMPFVCRRYTLTNRRIVIRRGSSAPNEKSSTEKSTDLDAFDAIDVKVLPGQDWLHTGELIFRQGGAEVLRLSGVPRPEVFRRVCLMSRDAVVSVRKTVEEQQSAASQSGA